MYDEGEREIYIILVLVEKIKVSILNRLIICKNFVRFMLGRF